VAPSADTCPGTLGRICPGGQATMAHFLQVPANDKVVTILRICPEPEKTDLEDE